MPKYLVIFIGQRGGYHGRAFVDMAAVTEAALADAEAELSQIHEQRCLITGVTRIDEQAQQAQQDLHFNPASALPGVDSMLILQVGDARVLAKRAEYSTSKDSTLHFHLPCGGALMGRFPWTYA